MKIQRLDPRAARGSARFAAAAHHDVVHAHVQPSDVLCRYSAAVNDHHAAAVREPPEPPVPSADESRHYIEKRKRDYGHDSRIKRHRRIVERKARDLGEYKRDHELERLHFPYLTFPHESYHEKH